MIHFTKEGSRKKVGLNLYRTRGGFVVAWVWYYPETHELKGWRFRLRMHMKPRILWSVDSCQEPTYTSTQATNCAECGEHKHTPLRIDAMGGYVCLTCIDKKLGSLLGEFGYEQPEHEPVECMCGICKLGHQRKPLTDEMVVSAARVLNERQADACGVDRDDQWAIYSDDFKADARAMLEAAHGIKEKK